MKVRKVCEVKVEVPWRVSVEMREGALVVQWSNEDESNKDLRDFAEMLREIAHAIEVES